MLEAHGEEAGAARIAALRTKRRRKEAISTLSTIGSAAFAGRAFTALHMTWGAINEWTTQAGYARLSDRADHPTLRELLKRIMKQEGGHIDFYASEAARRLAESPRAQRLTRFALKHSLAPGRARGSCHSEEVGFLVRYLFDGDVGSQFTARIDRPGGSTPGPGRPPFAGHRGVETLPARGPRDEAGTSRPRASAPQSDRRGRRRTSPRGRPAGQEPELLARARATTPSARRRSPPRGHPPARRRPLPPPPAVPARARRPRAPCPCPTPASTRSASGPERWRRPRCPALANSTWHMSVTRWKAALAAAYATPQPPAPAGAGGVVKAASESMLTRRPSPRSSMPGSTSWVQEQRVEVVADQAPLGQLERQVQDPVHRARSLVDGVVHQDVDPTQLVERHLGGVLDRRAVHQLHRYRQAGAAELLDRRRGGVEAPGDGPWLVGRQDARGVGAAVSLVHGPGRDGHVEAPPGQGDRGTAPDAAAGSGDEGDPARLRHGPPTSSRRSGGRRRRGAAGR